MIYITLILIAILILLVILVKTKTVDYDISGQLTDKDMEMNVKNLALSLRIPESVGASPNIEKVLYKIKKAFKLIRNKIKNNEEVYDYERWLYDNFNLIINTLSSKAYRNFALLPHKYKKARVIIFTDFLIKSTLGKLDENTIAKALDTFNKYTPLYSEEVQELENALKFSIIKEIAIYSEKILKFNKIKCLALNKKNIVNKYLFNDSYLFYLTKKGINIDKILKKKDIDINLDNIDYSFSSTLIDSRVVMENCIRSIKKIKEIITLDFQLNNMTAHRMMEKCAVYQNMDNASKYEYLKAVIRLSNNYNVSERALINTAFELEKEFNIHFGTFFYEYRWRLRARVKGYNFKGVKLKSTKRQQHIFITIVYLATIILSIFAGLFAPSMASKIIIPIVIWSILLPTVLALATKLQELVLSKRPVAVMNFDSVPESAKTMVIVSHFVSKNSDVYSAVKKIKDLKAVNEDKNIEYVLLVDYPKSILQTTDEDIEKNNIFAELLADENINVYVRKKVKKGDSYVSYERKRGAILALCELLVTGDMSKFSYVFNEKITKPEFVMFLDSDNILMPGAVKHCVNAIIHPMNEKYDLLAMDSMYNLFSINNKYSSKFYHSAGAVAYGNNNNFIFNLCGKNIFCGKGIARLNTFYDKLKDRFPDSRILSHDIIEGAILQTGQAPEVVYEDVPKTFVSEIERQNRWSRGDIGLLPFIKNKFKNKLGQKIKSEKEPIYKFVLFNNFVNILIPIILTCLFFSSLILNSEYYFSLFIIVFGLKYLLNIMYCIHGTTKNIRLMYVARGVIFNLGIMLFDFFILPFLAINNLYILLSTFKNMLFNKSKLLEWKTFAQSQTARGLNKHILVVLPSFVVMVLVNVLANFNLLLSIYTLGFYLTLVIVYALSFVNKKEKISQKYNDNLQIYAKNIYKYFDNMFNDKTGLICDNYQQKPYRGKNKITSPTNIGYSLLAEIAGYKLGFISLDKAKEKIDFIIDSIISLKKYKGHLYNWYDIDTKQIMKPLYVSSVDSGNLISALIVIRQFYKEQKFNNVDAISKLIDNADFSIFFNKQKNLYSIGYNTSTKKLDSYYDLLASESRLMTYILSAQSNNHKAWFALSRECTSLKGNTLLSWSGTSFEYLMPQIFLPETSKGLLSNTMKNIVKIQIKARCKSLFGIGESGYYKFDDELRYQYYAFGISPLSLRAELDKCVVSPYSSILALRYQPKKVMDNLDMLIREGVFGEYGFFEAVDFTSGKNIIYSYMSHHQGMALCSIVNFLCDDYFVNLFMNDEKMSGAKLLLTEKQIVQKTKKVLEEDFIFNEEKTELATNYNNINYDIPNVNCLSNGKYSVVIDDFGNGYSNYKGVLINRYKDGLLKNYGIFGYFKKDNIVMSPCYNIGKKNSDEYNVRFALNEAKFINKADDLEMTVFVPTCFDGEIRKYKVNNNSDIAVSYDIAVYLELSIDSYDSDISHPVFNDMFTEIVPMREKNALIAIKKSRTNEDNKYCAMVILGVEKYDFEGNRYNFIGRNKSIYNPQIFETPAEQTSFNDVLYPCLSFKSKLNVMQNSSEEFNVCILYSDTYDNLIDKIDMCNNINFIEYAYQSSKISSLSIGTDLIKTHKNYKLLMDFSTKLLYIPYKKSTLKLFIDSYNYVINNLNIDKYIPIVYMEYNDNYTAICDIVSICEYLNIVGIKNHLIIKDNVSDNYHNSLENKIKDKYSFKLNHIQILNRNNYETELFDHLEKIAFINYNKDYKFIEKNKQHCNNYCCILKSDTSEIEIPKIVYKVGNGGYDINGNYVITQNTLLPYSNVVCLPKGGFIITNNGGGYTFFENSRENKVTSFYNNPIEDNASEILFSLENNQINYFSKDNIKYVVHKKGLTQIVSCSEHLVYDTSVYPIFDGLAKIYEVSVKNISENTKNIEVFIDLDLCLGWKENFKFLSSEIIDNKYIKATNYSNLMSCCLSGFGNFNLYSDITKIKSRLGYCKKDGSANYNFCGASVSNILSINKGESEKIFFVLCKDASLLEKINYSTIAEQKEITLNYFKQFDCIKIDSKNKPLQHFFNNFLLYQVVSSRLNGRCGYYQTGGAIGFRDQLQDCLSVMYSDANLVREHILDCAKHQYIEGDVMHWWHPPNLGVKTKISDDKLFLPYVTSEYIKISGDKSILDEKVNYLVSEPLNIGQEARLEFGKQSDYSENLLGHLEKAIKSALKFGENGLLLIGSGDWNDALNNIGLGDVGESVWLTMFCYDVINSFIELIDPIKRIEYFAINEKLKKAVDKAFVDGWYYRATTDKGEKLGINKAEVCKIDLICQAYSAISEIGESDKVESALQNAEKYLVDKENGIIKLLYPPFNKKNYYGYISSYPEGVRENGGQYTHSAMWYIKALLKVGKYEKAEEMINLINPINKSLKNNKQYMAEPYVLSADVYSNKYNLGRAGWSWYTGSASWFYKIIIEDYYGIIKRGNKLEFKRNLLTIDDSLTYKHNNSNYEITFKNSTDECIELDGIKMNVNYVPLYDDSKNHKVIVFIKSK